MKGQLQHILFFTEISNCHHRWNRRPTFLWSGIYSLGFWRFGILDSRVLHSERPSVNTFSQRSLVPMNLAKATLMSGLHAKILIKVKQAACIRISFAFTLVYTCILLLERDRVADKTSSSSRPFSLIIHSRNFLNFNANSKKILVPASERKWCHEWINGLLN